MKKNRFLILAVALVTVLSVVMAVLLMKPELYTADPSNDTDSSAEQSSQRQTETSDSDEEVPAESIQEEWGSGSIYDGSSPIIRNMGEKLSVTALPPREQGEKPPMSTEVFAMWEGEMCFTVSSAVIYDTIEETGLNYDDFIDDFSAYDETFKPMVVKMTVEDVHAKSLTDPPEFFSDGYVLSSKEEFSPEKFRSQNEGEWRVASGMPLAYADPHSDGPYDYFHYKIGEGETVEMTLCYYVKMDDVPLDELYLEIQTSSLDHRFGIRLDQLEEAE